MRRQIVFSLLLSGMTVMLCAAKCGGGDKDDTSGVKDADKAGDEEGPLPDEQMNLNDPMPTEPDAAGFVDPSETPPETGGAGEGAADL